VALTTLVVQRLRRKSNEEHDGGGTSEQRRNVQLTPAELKLILRADDHRSIHVIVISCVELALSVFNAIEQDAIQFGSFPRVVFLASAVIEVYGFIFAVFIVMRGDNVGGTPILCIWEAHSIESKRKSISNILTNIGRQQEVESIDEISRTTSEELWRTLTVWGVGPQVLFYWVCAFLNACVFAPDGGLSSFSIWADVVSSNGLPFFAVLLYAILAACLVGLYQLLNACGCWGRERDYFYVAYLSAYLLLVLIELTESVLIFLSRPSSYAPYTLAALDLFLAVPAFVFVLKRSGVFC